MFLVVLLAHPGSAGQRAVKWLCVSVCWQIAGVGRIYMGDVDYYLEYFRRLKLLTVLLHCTSVSSAGDSVSLLLLLLLLL